MVSDRNAHLVVLNLGLLQLILTLELINSEIREAEEVVRQ